MGGSIGKASNVSFILNKAHLRGRGHGLASVLKKS